MCVFIECTFRLLSKSASNNFNNDTSVLRFQIIKQSDKHLKELNYLLYVSVTTFILDADERLQLLFLLTDKRLSRIGLSEHFERWISEKRLKGKITGKKTCFITRNKLFIV